MTRALTSVGLGRIGLGFLSLMISLPATGASLPSTSTPGAVPAQHSPLTKLQALLACQEADKAAAMTERAKVETHLRQIEAFNATLTDPSKHYLARQTSEQALQKDHEALTKIDERLAMADLRIRMTQQAMRYLPRVAPETALSVQERGQQLLADLVGALTFPSDTALEQTFERENGFVDDPVIEQRITRLLDQLQRGSPYSLTSHTVKILAKPSGAGAMATRTRLYIDRDYLTAARHPSDDELLFVLGHEAAHVRLHHVNWGAITGQWESLKQNWLTRSYAGAHPDYREPENLNRDASFHTHMAEYMRQQEAQADLIGAQVALAAGASPRGIKEAFTWMSLENLKQQLQQQRAGIEPHYAKMLEDHPRPDERLKALEQVMGQKFWERTDLAFQPSCLKTHP